MTKEKIVEKKEGGGTGEDSFIFLSFIVRIFFIQKA